MRKRSCLLAAAVLVCVHFTTSAAAAAPNCKGEPATIVGTGEDDRLRGTNGNDVIVGRGGSDDIDGLGGDDVVCGGKRADVIDGGKGNDRLWGGRGYDNLYGDDDDDELVSGRGSSYLSGGSGNDLLKGTDGGFDSVDYSSARVPVTVDLGAGTATGDGDDTIIDVEVVRGSDFDDSITGDGDSNSLIGGLGDDMLAGGGGGRLSGPRSHTSSFGLADVYYGGEGDDVLVGSEDFDVASWFDAPLPMTIDLAAGTATGEGTDTLSDIEGVHSSRNGDDIEGDASDNAFALEGGDDTVDGRGGRDLVFVTAFAEDGVVVDLAAGTSTGGGDDSLMSIEDVWGTPAQDTLRGDDGANELQGRAGNDSLYGEEGDDVLLGGRGNDLMDGGAGFDLCEQPPERGLTNCENP